MVFIEQTFKVVPSNIRLPVRYLMFCDDGRVTVSESRFNYVPAWLHGSWRHDGASNGGRLIVTWNCKNNRDKTKTIEYEPMDQGIWRSKLEDPWYVHNLVKQQDLVRGRVVNQ